MESELGKGTTFQVYLLRVQKSGPIAEDQEPARGEQICAPDISFDVFVEEILLVGLEGPAAAKSTGGVVPQATTSTTTNTAKDARQTKTDHGMRRSRA